MVNHLEVKVRLSSNGSRIDHKWLYLEDKIRNLRFNNFNVLKKK